MIGQGAAGPTRQARTDTRTRAAISKPQANVDRIGATSTIRTLDHEPEVLERYAADGVLRPPSFTIPR